MEQQTAVFTPNPNRAFKRPVKFNIPTLSGEDQTVEVLVSYKGLSTADLEKIKKGKKDDQVYKSVVTGVEGVGDAEGNLVDPAEAKDLMSGESSFVYAAVLEFYDARLGGNLKGKILPQQPGTG